ncbi:MAG TPA: NAD-dependent epimerase/dehydratase family protein [Verrucomicrobiae bacterium]|nr:NAD-dependent epimerase/dehydratase family protein [Verrucomicrobiae bacterium]
MNIAESTCIVSGTGGYLGGRVATALRQRGQSVLKMTRNPRAGHDAIPFQLGADIAPLSLAGASSLVHCAYDFKPLKWDEIYQVNVAGTEKLLRAAREAGVRNIVYISSISAFEGCRSLYGQAKLAAERIAHSLNAIIIRPGLVWGHPPGAMFGRLVQQVGQARILPLFGSGSQIQYLVHDEDLVNFIGDCAAGKIPTPPGPVTVAHERPWPFRQILEEIARANGKRISFIPVPWRLIWAPLKIAELAGARLNFRSDSLVSLMHQNPNPSFALQRSLGIPCRPFKPEAF